MNELVGAWVHGFPNGNYGGSHDFWLVFEPNGQGSYIYGGWCLYRHEVFRWHACPATQTFRIVNPELRYLDGDEGLGGTSPVTVRAGFHRYRLGHDPVRSAPCLVLSLPGLPEAEFLFQTRDPIALSNTEMYS